MTETDLGLQAERTALAWRRTQLSLLVVACLALRGHQVWVLGLALGTAAWLAVSEGRRYRHSVAMMQRELGEARVWMVLGTGLAVAVMAVFLGVAAFSLASID